MQSILQYRKFRLNLQEQIRRHGIEKVIADTSRTQQDAQSQEKCAGDVPQDNDNTERVSDNPDHGSGNEQGLREQHESRSGSVHNVNTQDLANVAQAHHETTLPSRVSTSASETEYDIEENRNTNNTLNQTGTRLGQSMTGVSVKSRVPNPPSEVKTHIFIVNYQGEKDPLNPHNWPFARRMVYLALIASIALIVGVASSIDSAAIPQARAEFGVSEVVESLATGLYLIGFGCGAFFAAPISETVGRNPVYLVTGVLFMIFVMASGLAPNIGAQLAFRFLAGFFGSTPLTCAGGSISDLFTAEERTIVFPIFGMAGFVGPIMGPVIGGFIAQSSALSWRWCEWITLIWAGLVFGSVFFILPETYGPVLLKWKAEHLRKLTGDSRYMSALEAQDTKFWTRLLHNLYRPWLLILLEPIVMLFTLYLSVVYIILFTFLTGFEFIFKETYGLSQGLTFLIFVALAIGVLSASFLIPFVHKRYKRKSREAHEQGHDKVPPEQRLIFSMIGAPFLPIGIFWMAWTAYPSVSVWSPIVANVPVGLGIIVIFFSVYQYLIDAFEVYAASALVGITFVRYVVAGGMIPVSIPFYKNLGVHWTLTVLGAIAAIMAPVPYIFYIFGERIRKKSRHAVGRA